MRKNLDLMDNISDEKSVNTNKENAAPPTTKGITVESKTLSLQSGVH